MISEKIKEQIKAIIKDYENVLLVYIFGSSIFNDEYNDIDIGILITPSGSKYESSKFSMNLARIIEKKLGYINSIDVKILNDTPIYFQNNVIKNGELIYYKNEKLRVKYEKNVLRLYLDYKYTLDWFKVQIIERN
ncbi:MAG: nucleotidyltransferase domain-containing protein [Candidatus Helarchaeota archaeon]